MFLLIWSVFPSIFQHVESCKSFRVSCILQGNNSAIILNCKRWNYKKKHFEIDFFHAMENTGPPKDQPLALSLKLLLFFTSLTVIGTWPSPRTSRFTNVFFHKNPVLAQSFRAADFFCKWPNSSHVKLSRPYSTPCRCQRAEGTTDTDANQVWLGCSGSSGKRQQARFCPQNTVYWTPVWRESFILFYF